MKRTSGKQWISLVLALCLCLLVGCGGKQAGYDPLKGVETRMITDSAGRQVEIPAEITRIAPSGSTAQMILMPVAYDLLVGLSSSPSTAQMPYFPEEMRYLPTFGQFYGSKANLNMESLIAAQPQLIIDLGDAKDSIAKDMDTIQKQTGIPTIFIEADLDDMAAAYRMLGDILGRQEQAEELAQFIDRTVTMAQTNAAKIPESQRLKVLFGTGSTGLACNAAGSVQADVIDLVGAVNAIIPEEVTNRGGGTTVIRRGAGCYSAGLRRPLRYPDGRGLGGSHRRAAGAVLRDTGPALRLDEFPAVGEPGAGHLVAGESAVPPAV